MIIDTHCHLNFPDFNKDRADILKRAADAGVRGFVTVATGPEEWQRCLDLAEGHPPIRVALGVHPNEAGVYTSKVGDDLKALAQNDSRVVAIGETLIHEVGHYFGLSEEEIEEIEERYWRGEEK
jgi:TatD DNase family protein